jgi:hypothetical protein
MADFSMNFKWVMILAFSFGCHAISANASSFQKSFESLIEKSIEESKACLDHATLLKEEMVRYQRTSEGQKKESLLKILSYLKKYPGQSESSKKSVALISASPDLDKNRMGWLGKNVQRLPVCSPLIVQRAAKVLFSSAQNVGFSVQERNEIKATVIQLAKKLSEKDGTLISYQVSANLLHQLSADAYFRLSPKTSEISQSYSHDLETVKQKLSQLFVGIKADEYQMYGTYFIHELQESEKVRLKYYKKIFEDLI